MNIAIACQDKELVSGALEKCLNFWVFEIVDGEIHNKHLLSLSEDQALEGFDLKNKVHPLDGVQVLIAMQMDKPLERQLKKDRIIPFVTNERDPDEAARHFLDGHLPVESAGHHKHHHFKELGKKKGYVPMAGVRHIEGI
ncbi:MAG: nitrogen fixation protein [Magnetococcales bacterium]|nr:nitrogen fixation protein [Magnetococcales bacterium]